MTKRRAPLEQLGSCLLLGSLLSTAPAQAWEYAEHYNLGTVAYREVCVELTAMPRQDWLTAEQSERLDLACRLTATNSHQYGQFVALAGDHLDIENIEGIDSNIAAKDFIDYLLRASHNAEHFHPSAPLEWRKFHTEALSEAVAAANQSHYLDRVQGFWRGFYLSAYADHFLEDSFAAGHSGFNRPASTPSASDAFHGEANREGKLLRDGAGRQWRTFGDAHLNDGRNREGYRRVLWATKASVRDFIVAFVLAKRSPKLERAVALSVPTFGDATCSAYDDWANSRRFETWNLHIDDELFSAWGEELNSAQNPRLIAPAAVGLEPPKPAWALCGKWNSLLQVQEPASYAVTHTIGATDVGRVIKDFEHGLALTYSFAVYKKKLRFGMDLGWYASTRAAGNTGVLLAPTVSFPIGGKYGTILAYDVDAKLLALFPTASYSGTAFDQHLGGTLGLGVSIQLGRFNVRASGGPAMLWTNRRNVDGDFWRNPGFGWYGQLGAQFIFAPEGGGRLEPPPI